MDRNVGIRPRPTPDGLHGHCTSRWRETPLGTGALLGCSTHGREPNTRRSSHAKGRDLSRRQNIKTSASRHGLTIHSVSLRGTTAVRRLPHHASKPPARNRSMRIRNALWVRRSSIMGDPAVSVMSREDPPFDAERAPHHDPALCRHPPRPLPPDLSRPIVVGHPIAALPCGIHPAVSGLLRGGAARRGPAAVSAAADPPRNGGRPSLISVTCRPPGSTSANRIRVSTCSHSR